MATIRGWRFPVEPDEHTGRIQTVEDNEAVRQGVEIILGTDKRERKMLPTFGAGLSEYMFENIDLTLVSNISDSIIQSIKRWETHIARIEANVSQNEENHANISVEMAYVTDILPERESIKMQLDLQQQRD